MEADTWTSTKRNARVAGVWYLLLALTAPVGLGYVPAKRARLARCNVDVAARDGRVADRDMAPWVGCARAQRRSAGARVANGATWHEGRGARSANSVKDAVA
jgi:hypothetical protein